MTELVYARHVACGAELEWRREAKQDPDDCPPLGIWCPTCVKFVEREAATTTGSLSAYRAVDA